MKQKIQKIKEFITKNLKWIVLFICIIIFLSITEDVFDKEIMIADVIGYRFISKYLISDFITPIAKIITNFGGAIMLVTLTLMSVLFIKDKKIGISVAINLVLSTTLNLILKNIVQRPRPTEFRLIDESGYSFPSGHSMVSMAFYGFIIYLIYKNIKNAKIKLSLITILSILIVTIGTSRIYLGVHYTSDVLAGFIVAISYLVVYTSIIKKFLLEREEKNEKQENNK